MIPVVVDASVVIKWALPETDREIALRLLNESDHFIAPDFLYVETANAIWKHVRRGEITSEAGLKLIAEIDAVAIEAVPCSDLATAAYRIAVDYGRSVYDALYVALAIRRNTRLITADDRLFNALAKVPEIAPHIQSLRDY
jgi:predicted nucleic acid-binding protein